MGGTDGGQKGRGEGMDMEGRRRGERVERTNRGNELMGELDLVEGRGESVVKGREGNDRME